MRGLRRRGRSASPRWYPRVRRVAVMYFLDVVWQHLNLIRRMCLRRYRKDWMNELREFRKKCPSEQCVGYLPWSNSSSESAFVSGTKSKMAKNPTMFHPAYHPNAP